jgi:hypothetical protein
MILVFLGVFVVTVAIYPNFNFTQSSEARFSGSKVPKIENNNIILPFSPTEDFVKGFEIFYSYNTVITGFKEIDSGKEILTTINDPNAPALIIENDSKTFIMLEQGSTLAEGTAKDLKVGQNIRAELYFYPAKNRWWLAEIHVNLEGNNK